MFAVGKRVRVKEGHKYAGKLATVVESLSQPHALQISLQSYLVQYDDERLGRRVISEKWVEETEGK